MHPQRDETPSAEGLWAQFKIPCENMAGWLESSKANVKGVIVVLVIVIVIVFLK